MNAETRAPRTISPSELIRQPFATKFSSFGIAAGSCSRHHLAAAGQDYALAGFITTPLPPPPQQHRNQKFLSKKFLQSPAMSKKATRPSRSAERTFR